MIEQLSEHLTASQRQPTTAPHRMRTRLMQESNQLGTATTLMTIKTGKKSKPASILFFSLNAFPVMEHLESYNYSMDKL